jgi:thiol peroxidase
MSRTVTFEGKPLMLVGRQLECNTKAPDFTVIDQEQRPVSLSTFGDSIKVITFFTSIDTPVCDIQIREFNKFAETLKDDVKVVGVSRDLTFAQKRFCATFHIQNMMLTSDYQYSSFGINYGVLIIEWNLLARGVVLLDRANTIRYIQIVSELANQPDIARLLENLAEVRQNPDAAEKNDLPRNCTPQKENIPPLNNETVFEMCSRIPNWELVEGKKLTREFKFKNFVEAKYFLDLLSLIAEEQKHHPSFTLNYNRLSVTLTTHSAGGLTENDFIMARIIDDLGY